MRFYVGCVCTVCGLASFCFLLWGFSSFITWGGLIGSGVGLAKAIWWWE